jgi:hypothetical protein
MKYLIIFNSLQAILCKSTTSLIVLTVILPFEQNHSSLLIYNNLRKNLARSAVLRG